VGWTLNIYPVTHEDDGTYSYPMDSDLSESTKLTAEEKTTWATEKGKAVEATPAPIEAPK